MANNPLIPAILVEQTACLNLDEFCHAIAMEKSLIVEMVEYQLINPQGETPEQWRFDSKALRRGRIAASFYHDLEINLPGIALALELMYRIQLLEEQIDQLDKIRNPTSNIQSTKP